mgnify:CR=1 FL=1
MWKLNDVTPIEYRSGYSVFVACDDGLSATIDFSDYLGRGPIFAPLRDPGFFRQALGILAARSRPSSASP